MMIATMTGRSRPKCFNHISGKLCRKADRRVKIAPVNKPIDEMYSVQRVWIAAFRDIKNRYAIA
jgi:hypothetical protein